MVNYNGWKSYTTGVMNHDCSDANFDKFSESHSCILLLHKCNLTLTHLLAVFIINSRPSHLDVQYETWI